MGKDDYPGMIRIPIRGMPKKRPNKQGNQFYMPKGYKDWKVAVGEALKELGIKPLQHEGSLALEVIFGSNDMWIQVIPVSDTKPKHMRTSDVDNCVGAVMDALENYGIYVNDGQIVQLDVSYKQEEE